MTQALSPKLGGTGSKTTPSAGDVPYGQANGTFTPTGLTSLVTAAVAATYDPQGISADAFDTDNHTSGSVNKVYTATEQTKLGYISVTQAVDLDQMEADIAALANGMVYKGNWDASAGTFPDSGSAQTGWFYTVSVGGTVDGVAFVAGDRLIAITDNASTTTYTANWTQLDATDAVTAVAGLTGSVAASSLRTALNVEDGSTANPNALDNLVEDTTPQLGGDLDGQDKKVTGLASVGFTQELDNGSKTTHFSIDFSTDQHQKVTLTANTMTATLDTTDIKVGVYTLKVVNGGLATLTWAAETGAVQWPSGTAPTLTSSGTDIISFRWDGTNFLGIASLNFS